MSLKVEIENALASAIYDICGKDSPTLDPAVPSHAVVITSEGGTLPYEQEVGEGSLVRVVVQTHSLQSDEFGLPNAHSSIMDYNLIVTLLTKPYNDIQLASNTAAELEEIIRLHLQDLEVLISQEFAGTVRAEEAQILTYIATTYDTFTWTGKQAAPVVDPAVATVGNSGALQVTVDDSRAYSGTTAATYNLEIVTPNSTAGSLQGLTYRYQKNGGVWSSALPATTGWNPLPDNIYIKFNSTGVATAGDAWTLSARTSETNYVAAFVQTWLLQAQATATY